MATPKLDTCPICNQPAAFLVGYAPNNAERTFEGRCDRCGFVRVRQRVIGDLRGQGRLHLLSAFFRTYPEKTPPLVTQENVAELLAGLPVPRKVPEKMNHLLKVLVQTTPILGKPAEFDARKDYPRIFASDGDEAYFLLGQLSLRELAAPVTGTGRYQVTVSGFEKLEELEATAYKSSRNAFVAMWFDSSRNPIYKDAIEPAVRSAGYHPTRIDLVEHVKKIDDEIVANLRQSRFLVADFSGQRGGVYFEAGFMYGLGRNVFWMVDKQELNEIHFDVRQYNFIDYESAEEAKERLYYRILAIEGRGPETGG